jgi:hypothetical protein
MEGAILVYFTPKGEIVNSKNYCDSVIGDHTSEVDKLHHSASDFEWVLSHTFCVF